MVPYLFREYALAKECITEKAKASCKICEYLKRDTYNPFCPNNTDPVLYENGTNLLCLFLVLLSVSVCLPSVSLCRIAYLLFAPIFTGCICVPICLLGFLWPWLTVQARALHWASLHAL